MVPCSTAASLENIEIDLSLFASRGDYYTDTATIGIGSRMRQISCGATLRTTDEMGRQHSCTRFT